MQKAQRQTEPQMWESCHMKRVKLWADGWTGAGVGLTACRSWGVQNQF